MNELIQRFIDQLATTSVLEWIAVSLAVAYLLLAIKESLWCWPAAFFSTAIYVYLFFDVNLYMESFLNLYYLLMAIYGWQQWHKNSPETVSKSYSKICSWGLKKNLLLSAVTAIIIWISSGLLQKYSNQDFPLVDSFTTWFAILATYMVTQKVIENWLYWIVIDIVSIYLYISKDFMLTAVLFFSYVILAVIGWLSWKKRFRQQTLSSSSNKLVN